MSDEEDMAGPPPSARGRRQSVCAEPFNPNAEPDDAEKVVHPKTDEQRTRLQHALHSLFLFKSLDMERFAEVMDAMFERKVVTGEHVIDQGDSGDNFYLIDSGNYSILVNDNKVGSYDGEGTFGELALMYNTPRAATIIADTDGSLWALDRATFRRILLVGAFKKRKMYEEFLDAVPMLSSLERYERMSLADALQSEKFPDGQCIIKQGEEAEKFFLVEKGDVVIRMEIDAAVKEIAKVEKGGYFGELALVTKKPRAASAFAVGDVTLASLDVGAFERLLGPCMDIMKRNFTSYEEQLSKIFGTSLNLTDARS